MPTIELTTNLLADLGGWPALKEARGLVERGRVSDARREGDTIRARVQGAEKVHEPRIILADRAANVEVTCTCAESRRTGRVCPHALAAGLALLTPPASASLGSHRPPGDGAQKTSNPKSIQKLLRWLTEDAPPNTPLIEITILLPLQLKEALSKDPLRIILESNNQPFDTVITNNKAGFAVSEEDDRLLTALEKLTGTAAGINAVPRAKIGALLRALDSHPRVWLGKKERISITATAEQPTLTLSTQPGGTLQLTTAAAPQAGNLPLPGWKLDGPHLTEIPALPPGFTSNSRVIPRENIPTFLSRELPVLEKSCTLAFAPGFEEFQLEIEKPVIALRIDGALSGLTLDPIARYGEKEFPLSAKTESTAYQHFYPDPAKPNRFWRRNVLAERAALAQIESAGFALVRTGAASFSLTGDNKVARFLANTLPRWRQAWAVTPGPRLTDTLAQVDLAQPEFSLRQGTGNDWLGLDLKLTVGGQPIDLAPAEIQRWLQTGQTHARTANKRVLLIPTEAWGEMQEVLADANVDQEPGAIRVPRSSAPFLTGALTAQGFRPTGTFSTDVPPPNIAAALNPELWTQLRPYQQHGVEWLASLAQQKFSGLLADDMGLGKTLQTLAFSAWLKKSEKNPVLVVCPTSLVTNWLREAAKFTPHLKTLDLTGSDRVDKFSRREKYDLLVTSYAILRRDIDLYRAADFSLVVLDEAQHIKNRASQNAQAAKALRAPQRLILTGTPLENSVLDLWSLYDFLLPGYLGTAADFRERYETPLTKSPEPRVMERLRHRVRPFFLRRTKEEVLTELPPKLEFPTLCELTAEQREVYSAVLAQGRRDVFEHSGKQGGGRDKLAVLTTLLRLRQVCCHLDLLPAADEKREWKEPSAKLERTFELIDEAVDGGHRVLLFSQFVRVLHLLRDEATRRGLPFCYLDGQTAERQAEVDRFQSDASIPIFFISLKASGTGLNLTGADTVIHFDPWWNPAVEEQATSRAHRMGQARTVQAYKLIAAGTVEEKIQALQARKRELFEASLGSDAAFVEKLTTTDLEELLAE